MPARNVTRLRRSAKAFCARYVVTVQHQADGLVEAALLNAGQGAPPPAAAAGGGGVRARGDDDDGGAFF